MDRRVGEYLHTLPKTGSPGSKQSLFIAETRESYWLPLVIKNAVREFPGWDLYVCAPTSVLTWLSDEFPQIKGIVLDIPAGRASVGVFNAIMYSPEIWRVFDTEYVLVFQCDTVMAPGAAQKLLSTEASQRDYYGAACGTLSQSEFVINGGLSYRRVRAFAEACALLTDEDKKLPEDVAYTRILRDIGNFPSIKECCDFAIESVGNPAAVIGIHGTDKGYAPPALVASVLGNPKAKIVDVMSYDGEPIFETRLRLLENVVDTFVLVQARYTHAGLPKPLIEPPAHPKIRHVIIDEFPPMPADFGLTESWIRPEAREAWWREQYQRDFAITVIPGVDSIHIYSDVDEIPDPAVLADLRVSDVREPVHLEMAFLVNSPLWQKREPWHKAFVCLGGVTNPTEIRNSQPQRVLKNAGWHCSSFFGVDRQIQKIQSFAHREFAAEIDPETIRARFESGKDPYGRGPEFDAQKTDAFVWLHFV